LEADYPNTREARATVAQAYSREAALAVRRSAALAKINQLPFDDVAEQGLAHHFERALEE
jgi:hypothetical protein